MIKDGHVGYREVSALLILYTVAEIFRAFPRTAIKIGGPAGWLIILLSIPWVLLAFYFMDRLIKKYPGLSIIEINEVIMGKYLGILFSLIILAGGLSKAVIDLRQIAETLKTVALPNTPISVLILVYILTGAYAAYQGIESITRGAWLLFPFILISLAIILFGIYSWYNPDNLFPIFGNGIDQVFLWSIPKASKFSELITLAIIAPYIRKNFGKVGWITILTSGFILTLVVIIYTLTFGNFGVEENAPLYQMASLIYYGRFFQRLEALFIIIWTFSGLFKITLYIYLSSLVIAQILKLEQYKPLIFPIATLLFAGSLTFKNYIQVTRIDSFILRNYSGVVLLIPPLLLLVSFIRNKLTST